MVNAWRNDQRMPKQGVALPPSALHADRPTDLRLAGALRFNELPRNTSEALFHQYFPPARLMDGLMHKCGTAAKSRGVFLHALPKHLLGSA